MARMNMTFNPLVLFNIELADRLGGIDLNDSNTILDDLSWEPTARTVTPLKERYNELRTVNKDLHMAPAEKWIQSKVIAPLRQAMANYVLSNYLSTIALYGMAAEMAAMLIYDMILTLQVKLSDTDKKRLIKFKSFQKKGQEKRIEHLMSLDCAGSNLRQPFDTLSAASAASTFTSICKTSPRSKRTPLSATRLLTFSCGAFLYIS